MDENLELNGEETPQVPEEKTEENQDLLKKFQSAEAQKEHWREKATKFETELAETKKQIPAKAEMEEPKAPSQIDPRDIVRLTKALQGFNDEEVSFIYRNAKSQNLDDIVEATKDPWVSSAIESQRQKVEQEKKVPEPGVVPGGLPKKELTVEDLVKDPDAHKRAFEKLFEPNQASGI